MAASARAVRRATRPMATAAPSPHSAAPTTGLAPAIEATAKPARTAWDRPWPMALIPRSTTQQPTSAHTAPASTATTSPLRKNSKENGASSSFIRLRLRRSGLRPCLSGRAPLLRLAPPPRTGAGGSRLHYSGAVDDDGQAGVDQYLQRGPVGAL